MKRALAATLDYVKKADMYLLTLCLICSVFGLVLIWSATNSHPHLDGAAPFLSVQIGALILGLVLFVVFSALDVEVIAQRWKILFVFNILLLSSLFLFGEGDDVGNRVWLRFFGFGVQPSEVVKITFIIMLAYHIRYLKEYKNLNSFSSMAQLLLHFSYLFLFIAIFFRDLGNGMIFVFIFLIMLYLGGVKFRWFILGFALLAALSPFLWNELNHWQQMRILAPFDPSVDPLNQNINFQPHRSRIAIASGQILGQGLGQGTQTQSGGVPAQWTDFIFSAAGEELGIIGAVAIIVLLALIIIRCFQVAAKARDTLSALTCVGVGAFVMFQSLENIGMTLGLTPVVGIALPFFGYGGSSLATTFAAMGLVCGVKMRTVSPWKR